MRFFASIVGGVIMALLLFLLMQALIGGRDGFQRGADSGKVIEFVRVRPEEVVQTKQREVPKKPPPPKEPPPPPKLKISSQQQVQQQLDIETPDISIDVASGSGPYLGTWAAGDPAAEGDIIPIVRIEPQYPRDALIKGQEGWVRIKFTILPDGSVSDPSVIAAEPPRVFNREAMRAILRWKFKPRIIDGKPVSREAEQTIEFKLAADQ
ncbi:MAG: energy transducer TonB [Gammaproteobacteria bacterium]